MTTRADEMKEKLEVFQRQRLEQEEELAFLRSIVSTETKKPGLRIKGFNLEATDEERSYAYQFTVSQVLKNIGLALGEYPCWVTKLMLKPRGIRERLKSAALSGQVKSRSSSPSSSGHSTVEASFRRSTRSRVKASKGLAKRTAATGVPLSDPEYST